MTTLPCPLCCNATFDSRSALKNHILEILDQLNCPSCHSKFATLEQFTQHLDEECREKEQKIDDLMGIEMELAMDVNKAKFKIENELQEPAMLKFFTEDEENETDVELTENQGQYFCQMCRLHFDDVQAHLNEFHEGQEFVVEEEDAAEIVEEEEPSPLLQKTIYVLTAPVDQEEGCMVEDEDTDDANYNNRTVQTIQQAAQESVTDKDGRVYTRKFVKIDKFWLQNNLEVKEPSVQQYIVESGEVKKITQEEADQIDDKNTIIEIHQCPDCKLQFPVLDHYKNHKCAAVQKQFRCTQCNSNFNDSNLLRDHLKLHGKKKAPGDAKRVAGPFNCETCNTLFPTFKSLRLHKRMHDPIKGREISQQKYDQNGDAESIRHMFICKICNKTYAKHYEEVHMQSHHVNNDFNCEVCNRKFYTKINLDMHMKAHSNNKKFACSYCKKPFVTYDALNNHLTNQCQKRPYACQYCGRRFARPHEKVKHERIHTGEKPHVCEICGKAFRVSYCLTLHLRTHSGSRPYQCSHCGKRFKSHSVYNHHMLTHSDVRAYKCPYCPKAFKTSVQLAGHKNSHIKPFTCTECNRPFASLYAVRAHMETHKRDNNLRYDCWMCGALYSRAFALRDHMKQQHNNVGDKVNTVVLNVEEEIDAANSLLVNEDDIILGLDTQNNIEIIEGEGEKL